MSATVSDLTGVTTYSSSIVSWGGSGSSRPSPIISHVKVLSSRPIPIFISVGNDISSRGGCGDSPLRRQRSSFTPPTMPIEGFVMLKSVAGTDRSPTPLTLLVKVFGADSGDVTGGSWVLSNVSTCSVKGSTLAFVVE